MKTLEQIFAERAYQKTVDFSNIHPPKQKERDEYGSMAHKLPILIKTAGLAEALAFVHSRGKAGHQALLADLANVVSSQTASDFVGKSRTADLQEYIYLTRQTMLALKWFKRFAQSVLEVQPTAEGDLT